MDCKIVKLNNDDQFISKIINSDDKLMQFYQFDAMSKESYKIKMNASPNGREKKLAKVIQSYMKDLTMTDQQEAHITSLANGAKVVIGDNKLVYLVGLYIQSIKYFHSSL